LRAEARAPVALGVVPVAGAPGVDEPQHEQDADGDRDAGDVAGAKAPSATKNA